MANRVSRAGLVATIGAADGDDLITGLPGGISRYNPNAVRGVNGIWNEDALPVTEWEAPEQRVVVPAGLREGLILPVPAVLRWDEEKYRLTINHRQRDLPVIRDLSRYLATWQYHGEERSPRSGNQRILFQDETGRWYAVSIGPLQDSTNVITIIGGSDKRYPGNRLMGNGKCG